MHENETKSNEITRILEQIAHWSEADKTALILKIKASSSSQRSNEIKPEPFLNQSRVLGCLIGGAIGDALGAPIEFLSYKKIEELYGKGGITDFIEHSGRKGEFTDDTQMLLFTAEGILRAWHRSIQKGIDGAQVEIVRQSYYRWLETQGYEVPRNLKLPNYESSWLLTNKALNKKRAPGNTCLESLLSGKDGSVDKPINNSKGCGTVMRIAPAGIIFKHSAQIAFNEGMQFSALTHGHPSGYLSGGLLSAIIALLCNGVPLRNAIDGGLEILKQHRGHEEVLERVEQALNLYRINQNKEDIKPSLIHQLGGGWVAEEALAISLLCALQYQNNFEKAVLAAVNHDGDSDSTGAITGNLVGLLVGIENIPEKWIQNLMNADIVEQVAKDIYQGFNISTYELDKEENREWTLRYPPN
jgi:ADP-ribosylglycohydrolase